VIEATVQLVLGDIPRLERTEGPLRRKGGLITRRALFQQALTIWDIAILMIALAVAHHSARRLLNVVLPPLVADLWLLWMIIPVWLLSLRWFGLYDISAYSSLSSTLRQLVRAHFVAALILLSTMYATKAVMVSRVLMQTFLFISLVALAVERGGIQHLLQRRRLRIGFNRPRVLLVGTPDASSRYTKLIERHPWISTQVIGLLSVKTTNATDSNSTVPVLGEPPDLPVVLERHVIDEVVALLPIDNNELEQLASSCAARGLVMRILVGVPQAAAGSWQVDDCGGGSIFLSLAAVPQDASQLAAKRLIDIVGGIAGVTIFGFAAAICARRLRRETGASALFRQQRVGRNGRVFTLYKFRTMYPDAERKLDGLLALNEMKGPMFKLKHDPRVTLTGAKLRSSHLDELPQFWNVLKGEMSLVGTRPPTPKEVSNYREVHHRRLSMKPGLTGLWQLIGNQAISDFEEVVKLDSKYIENWSLGLDFHIILQTIRKVMRANAS
jgi:exopolysaccharide biosynthesis polyprenyl glycosylphosphotransferase